jgi:uncharacterized DUF497 family protein
MVVYTERDGNIRIISSRKATKKSNVYRLNEIISI